MAELKVLTIAGFDPSAGAGLLADIKTFEAHGVYSFGVCTAVTVQNEGKFLSPGWIPVEEIIAQIECLSEVHTFGFVKIGLVENTATLQQIIDALLENNRNVKIVWDPVAKSSTGFQFHKEATLSESLLSNVYLVTPNIPEAELFGLMSGSMYTNVLLKGGHAAGRDSADVLIQPGIAPVQIKRPRIPEASKHGSGCVLSSSITANLSKGINLLDSCERSKEYVLDFLISSDSLLGIHKTVNANEKD